MNLNKVAVASSDLAKTIKFYKILGFQFPELMPADRHIESEKGAGATLMIDTMDLIEEISGERPVAGSHSSFAILYSNKQEIDDIVAKLTLEGFDITKEPWEAFWGQYYAIVSDPDGYKVDLYVNL